jgi:hypothetical protein
VKPMPALRSSSMVMTLSSATMYTLAMLMTMLGGAGCGYERRWHGRTRRHAGAGHDGWQGTRPRPRHAPLMLPDSGRRRQTCVTIS